MFIVTLKQNSVVNADQCLAFKKVGCALLAYMQQVNVECPYVIKLAEYSTESRAAKEFVFLVEALDQGDKVFYIGEEQEADNGNASNY